LQSCGRNRQCPRIFVRPRRGLRAAFHAPERNPCPIRNIQNRQDCKRPAGEPKIRGAAAETPRIRPFHKMSDPAPILDLIEAFRRSKTMFCALNLGIFDGERPPGAAVDRLLEACASLGLLEKRGDKFVNTPVADEYLRRSSPRT